MNRKILIDFYKQRRETADSTNAAVAAVENLEQSLVVRHLALDTAQVGAVREHVTELVAKKLNNIDRLRALARYFYLIGRSDVYIYFTTLFGSLGVLESIRRRTVDLAGQAMADRIFSGIEPGEPGAPCSQLPPLTQKLVIRLLQHLPPERVGKILAGNNHNISPESFKADRDRLKQAGSLERYLSDLHARQVAVLERHAASGEVWFEQEITPRVVDFVKRHPEVLSAVRDGDRLLVTKIPYDTENWLAARDPAHRRYFLCHCPFVRSSFLDGSAEIDPAWCACSAGFAKLRFDVLFDTELDIEVLETPLAGHDRCRFSIRLPDIFLKRESNGK